MIYIWQNIAPITLAGLVGALVLGLWFSRAAPATARTALLPGLIGCWWLAAILAGALILAPVQAGRWTVALGSAAIIWVGFVLPALAATLIARGQRVGAALADSAAWLAAMLAMAAVLRAVGVHAPS